MSANDIFMAALHGDLPAVQAYLRHKPQLLEATDKYGQTVLTKAAAAGNQDVVEFLIASKHPLDVMDKWGFTAATWAAREGHSGCLSSLHRAGAKMDAEAQALLSGDPKAFAHSQFLASVRCADADAVTKAITKDPSLLEVRDQCGQTALSKAAAAGNEPVVQALLGAKADVSALDTWGRSALYWALSEAHVAVAKALVKAGAQPEAGAQLMFKEVAHLIVEGKEKPSMSVGPYPLVHGGPLVYVCTICQRPAKLFYTCSVGACNQHVCGECLCPCPKCSAAVCRCCVACPGKGCKSPSAVGTPEQLAGVYDYLAGNAHHLAQRDGWPGAGWLRKAYMLTDRWMRGEPGSMKELGQLVKGGGLSRAVQTLLTMTQAAAETDCFYEDAKLRTPPAAPGPRPCLASVAARS
mmetsp:Transcript_3056/g.3642  ORF Transcript_3056/g.3642 Transcript_3056/m.3642 type:complete len:409 (+) Transcript_3056:26-1252(+)